MKADFWHERWETNQLGFHQSEVNPLLVEHGAALALAEGAAVFVPLCGKSLDMHWLRTQGHPVVGVEISPIACRDFFVEAEIEATRDRRGPFEIFEGGEYTLYCGDFFDLTAAELGKVRGVFDRASLIALPPAMRARYATHLGAILSPGVRSLLITLEYDESKMSGPPHSVSEREIDELFGEDFEIEPLARTGPTEPHPRFKERGLDAWSESVTLLTRKATA